MSEYRLDDLIRKGSEITEPTKYILFDSADDASCAVGTAMVGARKVKGLSLPNEDYCTIPDKFYGIASISIDDLPDMEITKREEKFVSNGSIPLTTSIIILNDQKSMSREAIAEWVGWLIDEKGYNLTIDLSPDEDDEEEEERELQPA